MKRSKIRILALALALALTIILATCGDSTTAGSQAAGGDSASASGEGSGEFAGNDLIPVIDGVGEIMAGSAIFVALGMDGTLGAVVATIVVLAYSCLSGLWGAQMTSVI